MRTSAPSNLITRAPATPPADRAILDQVDRVASRTRDGAGEPPDHRVEVSGDLADTVGFERSHGRPSPDPTPPVAPPPDGLVLRSSWPDPVIPDVTVPELLLVAAGARRDAPAVIDGPTGRTLTHADLARDVRRAAAGLAARGLGRGDVLAILAPNSPEWLIACYGAMTAGGVVTGIDPLDTPDVIATLLVDSGARFLLTVPPFASAARAALERAGRQIPMIVAGETDDGGAIPFAALLALGDQPPTGPLDPSTDPALLPYSGGTTEVAKGVMLTHRAIVANTVQMRTALAPSPDDRWLAVVPFSDPVGLSVIANVALFTGGAVVTLPHFGIESSLQSIETHRVTIAVVVPPVALAWAGHPAVDLYDLSTLRYVGCGAAPLSAELQRACARRVGAPVGQGYGMAEAVAGIAVSDATTAPVPGSVGRLLPGVEARLVHPPTGVDAIEEGELWVRGPNLMAGYLHNSEASAATLDAEGWLHTGDIARIGPDGELFVVDRLTDLIEVNGFQIVPAELEALLRTHPAVADAAVIPVPDERAGEVPKGVVVRSGPVGADEILAFVAARVAPHKRLRGVAFVDALPISPAGEILRRLLVAQDRAGALAASCAPAAPEVVGAGVS